MANPCLTLEGVSCVLPDGRTLFSNLNETFDQRPTGLVGRNGVGKSVLARILAGRAQPSSGRCTRSGRVHFLAQQLSPPAGATVASLAGLQPTLDALTRIESGGTAQTDFDTVGDRWNARQQLHHALAQAGLGHLSAHTPAAALSGGEAMRVALLGAWLSEADFLILDEPTNHLDRPSRQALIEQLQPWRGGLLVISHDRQLLDTLACTVELSSLGLTRYGGNHAFYAQAKAQEVQAAQQQLAQRKLERQRQERAMRDQLERQAQRLARGKRHGQEANQAQILLDRQKAQSEASTGKLRHLHATTQQQLDQRVREAAQRVEDHAHIALHALSAAPPAQRVVARLDAVALPFVPQATRTIHLVLRGQQRVGVLGANGCGKSTLLQVMAGHIQPLAGQCQLAPGAVYLDQRLGLLDPAQSALTQLQTANPTAAEGELRMQLAQLGLDAHKALAPCGQLSGGERVKAALACVLYASPPPPMLLLDEPSNHLDLPSLQALEAMLSGYQGALVVVSHDEAFLRNLHLTDHLLATERGWRMVEVG